MKYVILFFLAMPLAAQTVICLPYEPRLLKWLQGSDKTATVDGKEATVFERITTAHGVQFGEPAIEAEGAEGRRMCFSHSFTDTDEVTGALRKSDLTWLYERLAPVAVSQGVCAKTDNAAVCRGKVRAMGVVSKGGLPKDWRPAVAAPIEEKPVEEVKVIK